MLTKNFYNAVMTYLTNTIITNGFVRHDGTVGNTRTNMKQAYLWSAMKTLQLSAPSTFSTVGVRIGTGVTPATADDYTLDSIITSGLTVVNPSAVTVTVENGAVAAYASYTLTNTGTTAVAISEIGLFCSEYDASSYLTMLMDRTVLEEPIVINPGEAKPITYTIRFNYPVE